MSAPKIKFYLVHTETGQRYPISDEEVVIGRSSGDILFPDDPKLSTQHCRIAMTAAGLGVHDLGSVNGTKLEGKKLDQDKIYAFKIGNVLGVGQQQFKLQEASVARRVSPRRRPKDSSRGKKKDARGGALYAVMALALAFTVYAVITHRNSFAPPPVIVQSPYDKVDKEVTAIFDQYTQLGHDQQDGKLSDREVNQTINKKMLPALRQIDVKLAVVKGRSEYERRKLDLTRKMVKALINQLTAMVEFSQTKSKKAEHDLKKYSQELEILNTQGKIFRSRVPAQTDPDMLPSLGPGPGVM